jgi:hypothetical protein
VKHGAFGLCLRRGNISTLRAYASQRAWSGGLLGGALAELRYGKFRSGWGTSFPMTRALNCVTSRLVCLDEGNPRRVKALGDVVT